MQLCCVTLFQNVPLLVQIEPGKLGKRSLILINLSLLRESGPSDILDLDLSLDVGEASRRIFLTGLSFG